MEDGACQAADRRSGARGGRANSSCRSWANAWEDIWESAAQERRADTRLILRCIMLDVKEVKEVKGRRGCAVDAVVAPSVCRSDGSSGKPQHYIPSDLTLI